MTIFYFDLEINEFQNYPLTVIATNGHMVQIRHTGGQVHYYSRTGTLKERDSTSQP